MSMLSNDVSFERASILLNHQRVPTRWLGRALEWHSRGQRFDPAYLHQNNNSHSQCCVSYCFIQEEYEDEHSVKRCVPKPVQKMHGLFLFSMK